jgi:hypothetical protein
VDAASAVVRQDPPCKLVVRGVLDSSLAQVQLTAVTTRARVYSAAVIAQRGSVLFV